MRRAYLVSGVLFLLLGTGCFASAPSTQDPYSWDFGEAKEGEVLQHNFILTNDTQNTLNIKGVNTSCGCTVPKIEKNILSPGESTSLEVQFNTKGYSGAAEKYIYVNTDRPDNPMLKFTIKANIINPYFWDFGQVKEGEVLQHSFTLRNDSARTLNINNITTSCGCTTATIQKNILSPGETTFLEVSFDTKGYSGPTQQFVYVNTDNLDNPILTFIIKGEVIKENLRNGG